MERQRAPRPSRFPLRSPPVAFARVQGFAVTGKPGVLDLAAQRGLIDPVEAFTRLKATTFHYRQGLLDALLAQRPEQKK